MFAGVHRNSAHSIEISVHTTQTRSCNFEAKKGLKRGVFGLKMAFLGCFQALFWDVKSKLNLYVEICAGRLQKYFVV